MSNPIKLFSKEMKEVADKVETVISSLRKRVAELEEESRTKHEWGMTILGKRIELEQQVADLKEILRYAICTAEAWADDSRIESAEFELARERAK